MSDSFWILIFFGTGHNKNFNNQENVKRVYKLENAKIETLQMK
jgi:hypothetical protein